MSCKTFISCFFVLICLFAKSQNYYDAVHTKQFADFLFNTNQYNYAAQEYERLTFMQPQNDSAKLMLLKSYKLDKNYSLAIERLNGFFKLTPDSFPINFAKEYIELQIDNNNFSEAYKFASVNKTFSTGQKDEYKLLLLLLQQKWNDSYTYMITHKGSTDIKYANLLILANDAKNLNYKSPLLAGSLSAIIPGAGKFYTKNWRDGLLSFVIVGANFYQAYRGFERAGSKSAYGWIYLSLGTGFYLGNIFGSVKAAKTHNQKMDELQHQKIVDFYNANY